MPRRAPGIGAGLPKTGPEWAFFFFGSAAGLLNKDRHAKMQKRRPDTEGMHSLISRNSSYGTQFGGPRASEPKIVGGLFPLLTLQTVEVIPLGIALQNQGENL